jgi:hypothetical protein
MREAPRISVGPLIGYGTTSVTGRDGYSCAGAGAANSIKINTTTDGIMSLAQLVVVLLLRSLGDYKAYSKIKQQK